MQVFRKLRELCAARSRVLAVSYISRYKERGIGRLLIILLAMTTICGQTVRAKWHTSRRPAMLTPKLLPDPLSFSSLSSKARWIEVPDHAFSVTNPLGKLWIALTGHTLVFSLSALLVRSIIYSLPFAMQPFQAALKAVAHTSIEVERIPEPTSYGCFGVSTASHRAASVGAGLR